MSDPITIHRANLATVSVNIQVVKIGPKQMTLAVFRQLLEEDLFDPITGNLRGALWGIVNYSWSGHERCTHLLWQLSDSLRRSCIKPEYNSNKIRIPYKTTKLRSAAEFLDRWSVYGKTTEHDETHLMFINDVFNQTGNALLGDIHTDEGRRKASAHLRAEYDRIEKLFYSFLHSLESANHLFIAV